MQVQTTVKNHLTAIRMTVIKARKRKKKNKTQIPESKCWQHVDKQNPCASPVGAQHGYSCCCGQLCSSRCAWNHIGSSNSTSWCIPQRAESRDADRRLHVSVHMVKGGNVHHQVCAQTQYGLYK